MTAPESLQAYAERLGLVASIIGHSSSSMTWEIRERDGTFLFSSPFAIAAVWLAGYEKGQDSMTPEMVAERAMQRAYRNQHRN